MRQESDYSLAVQSTGRWLCSLALEWYLLGGGGCPSHWISSYDTKWPILCWCATATRSRPPSLTLPTNITLSGITGRRGVDHGGLRGSGPPWKYVGGQSMFWPPLKMSHSFTQNCCCITASFTTSRMNSWTLSLHWSCLCWRCYHLISDKLQADSVLQSMPLLLHWA